MERPEHFNCRCIPPDGSLRPLLLAYWRTRTAYTFTCNSPKAAVHFSHVWYLG